MNFKCFLGGSVVKNSPAKQETQVLFLDREDPLEKEMATHFSILAWDILWTEGPGRLQSMGSQRVGHDIGVKQQQQHMNFIIIKYQRNNIEFSRQTVVQLFPTSIQFSTVSKFRTYIWKNPVPWKAWEQSGKNLGHCGFASSLPSFLSSFPLSFPHYFPPFLFFLFQQLGHILFVSVDGIASASVPWEPRGGGGCHREAAIQRQKERGFQVQKKPSL